MRGWEGGRDAGVCWRLPLCDAADTGCVGSHTQEKDGLIGQTVACSSG